jgi:hypothetical protein
MRRQWSVRRPRQPGAGRTAPVGSSLPGGAGLDRGGRQRQGARRRASQTSAEGGS